jgi:gamma-glutamyl phosphate reductase
MGHAEGICHVYVDSEANAQKAISVVVDAKIDYPSACNAAETLLLHRDTLVNGIGQQVLVHLKSAGVEVLGSDLAMSSLTILNRSEEAIRLGLTVRRVEDFSNEYGDLVMSLEIVENVEGAISHIHKYGR